MLVNWTWLINYSKLKQNPLFALDCLTKFSRLTLPSAASNEEMQTQIIFLNQPGLEYSAGEREYHYYNLATITCSLPRI
jgi:hypothetical protein